MMIAWTQEGANKKESSKHAQSALLPYGPAQIEHSQMGALHVIYMRPIAVEEDMFIFGSRRTKEDFKETWKTVEELRKRNEEVWSRHPNFVALEMQPNDNFRKRVRSACAILAQMLDEQLENRRLEFKLRTRVIYHGM
ncbi:hypothetical protein COOONC_09086 [Cooperia oncophora]